MQCVGEKDGVVSEDNALLSEDQAVFLYSLRSKQTCADKPDLQTAAGRSTVVSAMFGVRTSIVRALWARYYSVREIEFVILVTARSCFAKHLHRATCLCVLFCACRAHVSHAWAHHHREIMETTTRPFWTEREILKHECDQFKSTLKVPALDAAAGEGVPLVEKKTGDMAGGRRFESLLARRPPSTTVALAPVFPARPVCMCVTNTSFPDRPRMLTGRQRTEDNGRSRRSE